MQSGSCDYFSDNDPTCPVFTGGQSLTVESWISFFGGDAGTTALVGCYGIGEEGPEANIRRKILEERRKFILDTLQAFLVAFPHLTDTCVSIVRCPARVNLRGMHIDSHGGGCNSLAIPKDTLVVFSREDSPFKFCIKNVISENTDFTCDLDPDKPCDLQTSGWCKYLSGALSLMQDNYGSLNGFSALVNCDIPMGAGLSSSHALVMCIIQACLMTNEHISMTGIELIEGARSAEFRAGAVTGLADQGTMKYARLNSILHTTFYQEDYSVIRPLYAPFPNDYAIVIVDSLAKRDLSGKEAANYALPRFAYSIGLGLIKEIMKQLNYEPDFIKQTDRLSYISEEKFETHGGTAAIYELLLQIPEHVTEEELLEKYPHLKDVVEKANEKYLSKLPSDKRPDSLQLRGPLLFGISECARAKKFFETLKRAEEKKGDEEQYLNELSELGTLMNIGHTGDSITKEKNSGEISDEYLSSLIKAVSSDGSNFEAKLEHQPGSFRASTKELDKIQDILQPVSLGASLTGAGMGGVVVGIVEIKRIEEVKELLHKEYYQLPNHNFDSNLADSLIEQHFHVTFPVNGLCAF